jgi:putative membrane protein
MIRFLFISVAVLGLPLSALAQTGSTMSSGATSTNEPSASKLSTEDAHFIKMAAIGGLAEVNDGKLAENTGGSSVKAIGTQMVTDHSKANDQLTAIAKEDGVTPPTMVDATHAAITAKLKTLSGAAFDKEYLQTELVGHEKLSRSLKRKQAPEVPKT